MAFTNYTPEEWFEQLDEGADFRRRFGMEDKWSELEAIYYNTHDSMMVSGPNILLSQGDAMMSSLTVPAPFIMVKGNRPEDLAKAPYVETLDNMFLEEMDLQTEVEKSILHAYLFGRGIIKFGYDSQWGYDPDLDIGGSLQLGLTLTQLDKTGKRQIENDSKVQPGMPWGRSVLPHDFTVPWGTYDIDNCPWVATRLCRHIDDLRADPKYENTKDLNPNISIIDFVNSYRNLQRPLKAGNYNFSRPEFVEFFEIMDRRTGKIICVSRDWNKFLRNDINELQIENRLPFASVSFTPRTRSFWTTPDAFYLYFAQCELSDIALQRTKQRRLSVLKFLYEADAISQEELEKVLSPEAGVAAKVEGGRKLNEAIMKLDNQPMNQGFQVEEEVIRSNAREQIGFSRNQVGEYSGGRKTASEVMAVERSSQLRMSRRGQATKKLYEQAIKVTNGIVFEHWTMGRLIQVLGQEDTQKFMQVNGPMLKGRYGLKIDFVDENEANSRKMAALQLYGLLKQDPDVNPQELSNFLVSQVNDPAFARLFNAPVRPSVQQMPAGGGSPPPNVGNQPPKKPMLSGGNGENGFQIASGLMARRRPVP